jgi:hypothetical protein
MVAALMTDDLRSEMFWSRAWSGLCCSGRSCRRHAEPLALTRHDFMFESFVDAHNKSIEMTLRSYGTCSHTVCLVREETGDMLRRLETWNKLLTLTKYFQHYLLSCPRDAGGIHHAFLLLLQ